MLDVIPASPLAFVLLLICMVLVLAFEFANGFHDTANAVATVIYTNSLRPKVAVVWSGLMNFTGVLVGGIAVAYALVELLPPDVLSPPNGSPAIPMLVSLFVTALAWNVLTWWYGLPNSSSHCVIGALIGIAIGDGLLTGRPLSGSAVDWGQVWTVLRALAVSPLLGLVGAGLLYFAIRHLVHDRHLYQPPQGERPPTWWVRTLLVLTCTSVSFSHGTNDGQKSIGLIMLTIIGLMPAHFALNPLAQDTIAQLPAQARAAEPLIRRYGDDQKAIALRSAEQLAQPQAPDGASRQSGGAQSAIRGDIYRVVAQLKAVEANSQVSAADKATAGKLRNDMRRTVEYAPTWVRALSALCLGLGTMVGYRRIVDTLGERVGRTHLTPAQGAAAELVGAGLIGTAGFTGLPVSTTHIITSGIAGTMLASGAGVRLSMASRIVAAWVLTLPVTIAVAAGLFYALG